MRYRNYTRMYTKMFEKCMKYVTDSNGNISMEKLTAGSKKIMTAGWLALVVGLVLMLLSFLFMFLSVIYGKNITLAMVLMFICLFPACFILSFFPIILQVGYTFKVASQCLKENVEVIKCPFCGNILDDNHNFCGKCGAKFKLQNTCDNCGTVNSHSARYCKTCGSSLVSKVEQSDVSHAKLQDSNAVAKNSEV